jgi:hypothetical protein
MIEGEIAFKRRDFGITHNVPFNMANEVETEMHLNVLRRQLRPPQRGRGDRCRAPEHGALPETQKAHASRFRAWGLLRKDDATAVCLLRALAVASVISAAAV